MNQLLKPGSRVKLATGGTEYKVGRFLGGGGQGEVYEANSGGNAVALKWYFPQSATDRQKRALETLIANGAPTPRFLWPLSLAVSDDTDGFGYIMPLRGGRYKSIVDLMKRRVSPSFRALATTGLELSHSFLQLHAKGMCYRDISFGNVFFDPDTGEALICDNDNVAFDGVSDGGMLGTPGFMAPEVVRGEALPGTQTDLHSLALLLFYLLMGHHPLDGKREYDIHCKNPAALNKLYGFEPVFIYDPDDDSNRPVPGEQDNAIVFWPIYPQFLRDLFTRAFTEGIRDPLDRIRESEWRAAMGKLRDSIIYCGKCGAENFYDMHLFQKNGRLNPCWDCNTLPTPPPRIRIEKDLVMLNHDTQLCPHHVDSEAFYDFSKPVAEVARHPKDPNIWGLKNLSNEKWTLTLPDGSVKDVEPGRSATLSQGAVISFGKRQGEIRV